MGNLVGGFIVGAIGARLRKGWLVITGFAVMGVATVALGPDLERAAGRRRRDRHRGVQPRLRHPQPDALRRAGADRVSWAGSSPIRSSIVMGALTGAMAVSAGLTELFDAGVIIAFSGGLTVLAAVLALALPAVRDA